MQILREFDVENYVADYDFRFDGGQGYTPADHEKVMLVDAITGALGEIEEAMLAASPGTQEGGRIAEIRKRLDRAIDSDWETGGERIRKGFGGDVEYLLSQAAYPSIINLTPEWVYNLNTCSAQIGNAWVPARALGFASWRYRWRAAWLVFTGRADALVWPGQ